MDDLAVLDGNDKWPPPKVGNFALPGSQQPGPFVSFGQTLIGRNYLQLTFSTYSPYRDISGPFDTLNASLTYGVTDNTSLYFNFPVSADRQAGSRASHNFSLGLRDISLQLEQAIYTAGNKRYQDQITIVGALLLPINDVTNVNIPEGYSPPSYFFGTTYNRTYVDWFGFVSPGFLFSTSHDGLRLGSQYMYQAGIGRNIFFVGEQSSLFGLLELDGNYTEKNRGFGADFADSGGNVITLTPSLTLSTQTLMVQVGIGFPVVQNLYGSQNKMDYFIASNIVWTIH